MVMLGGRGNLEASGHGLGGVRDEKKQRCSQHSTLMREEDSGAHNTAGNNNRTLNPKDDDDDNLVYLFIFLVVVCIILVVWKKIGSPKIFCVLCFLTHHSTVELVCDHFVVGRCTIYGSRRGRLLVIIKRLAWATRST
mmetsp:Transcript_27539/g.44777  ORF Transcript_27539/g.44777 Transcript_27539/m.44777 type:complete len:138 (-) Transcript_27539:57-470(-)